MADIRRLTAVYCHLASVCVHWCGVYTVHCKKNHTKFIRKRENREKQWLSRTDNARRAKKKTKLLKNIQVNQPNKELCERKCD